MLGRCIGEARDSELFGMFGAALPAEPVQMARRFGIGDCGMYRRAAATAPQSELAHIAEIITYDDLLRRLKLMLEQLRAGR